MSLTFEPTADNPERLAIRDAIVLQQPLLELLLGAIEAKKALCLASIEVVQVSGLALDGAEQ